MDNLPLTHAGAPGPSRPGAITIVARVLAAMPGAYFVAWTYTSLLSVLLIKAGLERSNAVAWATLSSFLVYLALALWSFAARSTPRLWLTLIALTVVLAVAAKLMAPA